MSQWYYAKDGSQQGPYDADDMRLAIKTGELSGSDLVWREGMADWQKIKEVAELASALPAPQAHAAHAPVAAAPVAQPAYQPQAQAQPLQYQQAYSSSGQIMFTPRAMDLLRQTKPWVRFLAIMGFIVTGLSLVIGLIAGGMVISQSGRRGAASPVEGIVMIVVYILISGVYFFLAYFLNQYANKIGRLVATQREDALEAAIAAQKTFWRLLGIIVIAVLALYLLVIVGAAVLAAFFTLR